MWSLATKALKPTFPVPVVLFCVSRSFHTIISFLLGRKVLLTPDIMFLYYAKRSFGCQSILHNYPGFDRDQVSIHRRLAADGAKLTWMGVRASLPVHATSV